MLKIVDMKFSEALTSGGTKYGLPDRVITTLVSDVFIFGEKVLKVYKKENFFFADLDNFASRKAFYEEDFFWNNVASPEVYLHLWGVKFEENKFELVPFGLGEDFVIEMSKIDDSQTLTKILLRSELTKKNTEDFIDALVDALENLTKERRQKLNHLFERGLKKIMLDDIQSLYDWMLTESRVTKLDSDAVRDLLIEAVHTEPYFSSTDMGSLSAAFDNNCDNLILIDGKPSFIDILSPMEEWRVVDEYATVSRTIVDIEVLQSGELGKLARAKYEEYGRDIPIIAKLTHELRAAAIQWPYRYMIKQGDIAEKFGEYTKNKMRELRTELDK